MGMELLMAARVVSGIGHGARSAGNVFGGATATGTGAAASGFTSGFASRFKGNSYVRDAVVQGGQRMGAGGTVGFVGRAFGGMAARNGAQLTGDSIASVAARTPNISGTIAGDIADRSLANYMPHLSGMNVSGAEITGGQITAKVVGADGKETSVAMYNAAQFEKPDGPHSVVTASDGSQWYQMASGAGAGAFYDAPQFNGSPAEAAQVAATFPDAVDGTTLRTVGDGVIEASHDGHNTMWYNSAYYDEPDAPHTVMTAANGVDWYAMNQHADAPQFEAGDEAYAYRLIWNQICDALIYSTRRQANETTYDVTPYTAEQDDTDIELGIAIDQALDKAKLDAPPSTVKGIDAIRLMSEGYTCREIGEQIGATDKQVAAMVSKARKFLKSRKDVLDLAGNI